MLTFLIHRDKYFSLHREYVYSCRAFTDPFFPNHFFYTKIFLVVIYNICNRYSSGSVLTDLKIYKENVCTGKLVAKKWTW